MTEQEAREDAERAARIQKACDDYAAVRAVFDAYDKRQTAEAEAKYKRGEQ